MKQTQNNMASGHPLALLLKMSVPIMISMTVQSLYNIVDSIFVARLGNEALSAVSLVYPLQNIILAIGVGFGVGVCSIVSMDLGSQNAENANRAASTGMFLSFVHTLIYTLVGLLIAGPFLKMFTNNPNTYAMGLSYANIVIACSFAQILQITFEKIFQALGRMVEVMLLLGVGAVINIILDPIFIFGLLGFPAMGVAGAALATVIGQIVALAFYVVVYLKRKGGIALSLKNIHFDKTMLKRMYSIGIPSAIMIALPSLIVGALNAILLVFSELYVAVLGLYFKLQTFIYFPAGGIIQGVRPLISYNYGAKEHKRVYRFIHLSLAIITGIMAVGTLGCELFPQQLLQLFNDDPALLEGGVSALRIIALGFLFSGVSVVYAGVFEALGKGRESLLISLIRQVIVLIPLSYLLSLIWGAAGVWLAFPIAELCGCLMSWYLNKTAVKTALQA